MPVIFTHPQLWAEDIGFFQDSLVQRWSSFGIAFAGYLCTVQTLVAFIASFVSPVYAAEIYCYTAIFLTLAVVWLATSPRLDMPFKPLLAISVVIVPMGYEELGTLANIQWILPIGAFALMFMQAAKARLVLLAETVFVALMALSGPFSIFLTPMFLWRLMGSRGADKSRMCVLTAINALGAFTQILFIERYPPALNPIAPAPYARTLWVNLPASHIMTDFGAASLFQGIGGALLGLVCLAGASVLAVRGPYRTQKIFMLLFTLAVAISGMYKFRAALATQIGGERYFYSGSVFLFWFICCISSRVYERASLACVVAGAQLLLLPVIANTPRPVGDLDWPVWASYSASGLPVIIPTSPPGYYVYMPPAAGGPLAGFQASTGKELAKIPHLQNSSSCIGGLKPVEPLTLINISPLAGVHASDTWWSTYGWAWDMQANSPVKLVLLVNAMGKVAGFGLPGFKAEDGTRRRSKWNAIFYAAPGSEIRAYAILQDGVHICPLANQSYFPVDVVAERPFASERFARAVALLPGSRVVQRFKPSSGLVGMSETFVSFGRVPSEYTIQWRIESYSDGHGLELGVGNIKASSVADWQNVKLPMIAPRGTPDEIAVSFQTDTTVAVPRPAGIPLFVPDGGDKDPPVEIDGIRDPTGLQAGLTLEYDE